MQYSLIVCFHLLELAEGIESEEFFQYFRQLLDTLFGEIAGKNRCLTTQQDLVETIKV